MTAGLQIKRRHPLVFEAVVRQLLALAITAVFLVSIAAIALHQANRQARDQERSAFSRFFEGRVQVLERQWQEAALRYQGRLEFSRILEDPNTRERNLMGYFTAQSVGEQFSRVVIRHGERVIFERGTQNFAGHGVVDGQSPAWHFDQASHILYRVYQLPIWLGPEGVGRIILYKPIDNAILYQNAFPETELFLTWGDRVVATSAVDGRTSATVDVKSTSCEDRYVCVAWDDRQKDSPVLKLLRPNRPLAMLPKLGAYALGIMLCLAVALWFSLGVWLMKLSRRITNLSNFSRSFATAQGLSPDSLKLLDRALHDRHDEVREVASSLRDMASAIHERDQKLLASIRVRDEFISIASHELKTPVTALSLQLQTLGKLVANQGALNHELLGKIGRTSYHQVTRLNRLIEDLLSVTRIRAGKLDLHLEQLELGRFVTEVVDRMRSELGNAGCEVRVTVEPELVGEWDRFRLEQVLVNLLTNAMKFGRGKPVDIEVRPHGSASVELLVRDRGIGIAPEDQAKMFQRFERFVSERHYGGLGLGLYIVRRIVEEHHGSIRVASDVGLGATFSITLPREQRVRRVPEAEKNQKQQVLPAIAPPVAQPLS